MTTEVSPEFYGDATLEPGLAGSNEGSREDSEIGASFINSDTKTVEEAFVPVIQKKKIRKVCSVPRKFKISLDQTTWRSIRPNKGSNRLRQPWTHVIYDKFTKRNPCCVLAFKYQHTRMAHSRKKRCPYMHIKAVCTFPTCKATYIIWMEKRPTINQKKVLMTIYRHGPICHLKEHTRARQASNIRRGKIAKTVRKGVSHRYYQLLSRTPEQEIIAGNLTRSLNRDILKAIGYEVRKAATVHDNVLLEILLTQKIMRECDTQFYHLPGYIQVFQVDPFSTHLYTEKGIGIMVAHLRKKSPLTLHLDATRSVVSKIPEQNKRVLYYALVLAGQGRGSPPLPVAEMLTNDHTVPSISFWLVRFLYTLSKFTIRTVSHVETDYSWALMQAVLLAFNKESISSYLDRCFAISQGRLKWKAIRNLTVLHLCSAHVLKAVTQVIGRHVTDKGHREFVIFVFARLQNSRFLTEGVDIFRSLCIILLAKTNNAAVEESVQALEKVIRRFKCEPHVSEDRVQIENSEDAIQQSKTIVGSSPFSAVFRGVCEDATAVINSEEQSSEDNMYYCPGIIKALLDNYMSIFPMWSGLMLGDRRQLAADIEKKDLKEQGNLEKEKTNKTRETNCHVEGWFGIVKQHILRKKKQMRPGNFIRTMYTSLHGRYIEHSMQNDLPDHLIAKPLKSKDVKFSEETWAKKNEKSEGKVGRSKFYSVPDTIPVPKKKRGQKKKGQKKKGQKKGKGSIRSVGHETSEDDSTSNTDAEGSEVCEVSLSSV